MLTFAGACVTVASLVPSGCYALARFNTSASAGWASHERQFQSAPPPKKKTVIGVSIGTGGEGVVQIETLVRRTGWVIAGLVAFAGLVVGCYGTACEDCETQTSNLLMVWSETPSRDISCWCHPLTVFLICVLDQIFGWSTVFHVTVGMATWCPPPA